jgi:hypothetical protein
MAQLDMFDSLFDEDDDGSFHSEYIITATFPAQFKGRCRVDDTHVYKVGDYVGKLERTDNPFIPVQGVACNRCIRLIPHEKSL